jgi:hypothetical protein
MQARRMLALLYLLDGALYRKAEAATGGQPITRTRLVGVRLHVAKGFQPLIE